MNQIKLLKRITCFLKEHSTKTKEKTETLRDEEKIFGEICFSQTGEDGILRFLCGTSGFYVDVGAHHPLRFSNTHLLYKRGWRGINIDINPGFKNLFDRWRPNDINLETAIGQKKTTKTYYNFDEPCYNTFQFGIAQKLIKTRTAKLISKYKIRQTPLGEICRKYIPIGQKLDLLTIDAEGSDLDILLSHDWFNYTPDILIIERLHGNLKNLKLSNLLKALKFKKIALTPFSEIFMT